MENPDDALWLCMFIIAAMLMSPDTLRRFKKSIGLKAQDHGRRNVVPVRTLTASERILTACHEAGHATIAVVLMPELIDYVYIRSTVVISKGNDAPVGENEEDPKSPGEIFFLDDPEELQSTERKHIVVDYGGMHGERIGCGEHSTGVGTDVSNATRNAYAYILDFGLPGKTPIGYEIMAKELDLQHPERQRELWEAIENLLSEASAEALAILKQQDVLFRAVVAALLERGRLDREDLIALRDQHFVTHLSTSAPS